MKKLEDLFFDELSDIYDAEQRIVRALPKMKKAATCQHLQDAIENHSKETKGHVARLEKVFKSFDKSARGKKCEATIGLLQEGERVAFEFKGSPAINAALIAAAQKVEHYEIASYGCLREWAGMLGNEEAAQLLEETLAEEKAADDALTELARVGSNEEARLGVEPGEAREPKRRIPANAAF